MVLIKCFFWGVWVSITPQLTGPWVCNTTCFLVCTTSNSFWGCNLMFLGLGFCMQLLECCLFCSFCLSQARFFFQFALLSQTIPLKKGCSNPLQKGCWELQFHRGCTNPWNKGKNGGLAKHCPPILPAGCGKNIDNTLQKVKGETRLAKKRKGHHFQHKEAPKAAPAAGPANTRLLGKR